MYSCSFGAVLMSMLRGNLCAKYSRRAGTTEPLQVDLLQSISASNGLFAPSRPADLSELLVQYLLRTNHLFIYPSRSDCTSCCTKTSSQFNVFPFAEWLCGLRCVRRTKKLSKWGWGGNLFPALRNVVQYYKPYQAIASQPR